MRLRFYIISIILFILYGQAIYAQKVLMLQKAGTTKHFFYHTGDKISVRMGDPEFTVYGEITYIDDSICTVNNDYTFQLCKVKEVLRNRHFLSANWKKLYLAAILYAGGSMINRALHDEVPLVDNTVYIVSGSFIVLGTTAYLLRYRHCKMEDNWHLKVLDYDIFKERHEAQGN